MMEDPQTTLARRPLFSRRDKIVLLVGVALHAVALAVFIRWVLKQ